MRTFLTMVGVLVLSFSAARVEAHAALQTKFDEQSGKADLPQATDRAFDPFLFSVLGDCQNIRDHSAFFRTMTNVTYPLYAKDKKGRGLVVFIRLNLMPDRTYWGEYSEDTMVGMSGSVTELQSNFHTVVEGGWQIEGDRLVIDHIGELRVAGKNLNFAKAELVFTKSVHDERLVGHRVVTAPVTTDLGPSGKSINEFCKVD